MTESVIAIIFDFDETLGSDSISFFLQENKINPALFWQEINEMVKDGWDPPLAYMYRIVEMAKAGKIDASEKFLSKIGRKLPLYPGLPKALRELQDYVRNNQELKQARISLEFYIVSGGLELMVRVTKLASYIDGIFGCNFYYDKKSKQPVGVKTAISFTEKTRYVHAIRKGISVTELRSNPYKINDAIASDMQRIPFPQMIYIGDGPSDVPCLSMITSNGGTGIGVSGPFGTFKKGYELAKGKRITVGPYTANYKKESDMRKVLEETILRIGLQIDINRKKDVVNAPGH